LIAHEKDSASTAVYEAGSTGHGIRRLLLAAAASHAAALSGGTALPVHLKYAGRASPAAPALRSSAALVLDTTHASVLYSRRSDIACPSPRSPSS